jgi:hypothetical protein
MGPVPVLHRDDLSVPSRYGVKSSSKVPSAGHRNKHTNNDGGCHEQAATQEYRTPHVARAASLQDSSFRLQIIQQTAVYCVRIIGLNWSLHQNSSMAAWWAIRASYVNYTKNNQTLLLFCWITLLFYFTYINVIVKELLPGAAVT